MSMSILGNELDRRLCKLIEGVRSGDIDRKMATPVINKLKQEQIEAQALRAAQDGQRRRPSFWDRLNMRMDWDEREPSNRKIALFEDSGFVFVVGVLNGEPFTLKDGADLFPSDQVVTQLRLLYNGD